jgi:hypothetical protein
MMENVNKMSGKPEKIRSSSLERDGITLNGESLASALNELSVSVNSDIPPLDKDSLPAFLPSRNDIPIIQPYEVCDKPTKQQVPRTKSQTEF